MPETERLLARLRNVSVEHVRTLRNVDLDISAGGFIGLTGPSGAGKSTLARCIAGWQFPSAGSIERFGQVQLVMQDPGASLNPRFTAFEIVEEPMRIKGIPEARRIFELLDLVGIGRTRADKKAAQFSGGERARLAIARALAAVPARSPALLILDESLSSLDPETRDRILELLSKLQEQFPVTYLLISHDRDLLQNATRIFEIRDGGLA